MLYGGRGPSSGHWGRSRALELQLGKEALRLRYRGMAKVVRHCWPSLAALFTTYLATASIFPGVLGEDLRSEVLGDWYPILLITLYNVADVAGKVAPIWPDMWLQHQPILLAAAVARACVLVPALVLAASWGASIGVVALLTALLGLSNGCALYCSTAPAHPRRPLPTLTLLMHACS